MSRTEQRLRAAERSGDDEALLRERLRAGEVTREQIELAASLGHPAARALCPQVAPRSWPDQAPEAAAAAQGLLGETLPVRVFADWAERTLPIWEAKYPDDPRPRQAIAAARAWVDCPCPEHQEQAEIAYGEADRAKDFPLLPPAERLSAEQSRQQAEERLLDAILGPPMHPSDFPEPDDAACACSATAITAAAAYGSVSFAAEEARSAAFWPTEAAADPDAEGEWQRLRLAAYVLGELD